MLVYQRVKHRILELKDPFCCDHLWSMHIYATMHDRCNYILFGCKCISGIPWVHAKCPGVDEEIDLQLDYFLSRWSWPALHMVGNLICNLHSPVGLIVFFGDNPPGIRHGNGKTSLYTDNVLTYLIWTDERVIFHSQFWLRNASSYMQLQLLEGVKAPSCCFQFGS